jgi:GNAT superfamily N-acetyltransferase
VTVAPDRHARIAPADGWRYLRRRGVKASTRAFVERYVYRAYTGVVVAVDIAGPPAPDRLGDIVFRQATPADLARLDDLDRYGRGTALRAEVAHNGDWLFIACHGDRIVATRRCSRVVPVHSLMSRVVRLEEGQIWGADVFCVPEYRNRGIGRHLALFGERVLATLGYRQLLGAIATTNTAAVRMHEGIGRQPVRYVSYFRLFFYERLRVTKASVAPV